VHSARGTIGDPCFRGGAEIQTHVGWNANRASLAVDLDRLPAGRYERSYRRRLYVLRSIGRLAQKAPVAVIAGQHQRIADRRVDIAVRQLGGAQRDLHRFD